MKSHCLPFSEIPHTTKLFSAFLEDFERVTRYFSHPPTRAGVASAAAKIALDPGVRRQLVTVLTEQNSRFAPGQSLDSAASRNLDRLAHGAAAIVTGQQVGLFSGPAYTFYKAISAVRWADELTRAGVEAVPVFWLATEDHDLAEVNQAFWNTSAGLTRYEVPGVEASGRSVGDIAFGEPMQSLVAQAEEFLSGPFTAEVIRALRESYSPVDTWGSAFGKLLARLLAGRGLLFLDPLDPRLHRLAAPVYLRAVKSSGAVRDALIARSKELEDRGFHAQVKVTSETTLLFYNVAGRREPVRERAGGFLAGDRSFTRDELCAEIERAPKTFTPNVLLRPIVQDTFLPTAAYIGGPAEIAYLAQAETVYRGISTRMPAILPRASFTIVEPAVARLLEKYGLDIRGILEGKQHVRARMERKSVPPGLTRQFEADEAALHGIFSGYDKLFEQLDPTLLPALRGAERKALYQLSALRAKASRAENFRTGVLDRHEAVMLDALYPHHDLQERTLCALPWLAAYGSAFLDDLARAYAIADSTTAASPCLRQHQVAFL